MRIECERKRNIEGEISGDEARRLVDEYYETRLGHGEPIGHQMGIRLIPGHETRPARFSPMTTSAFTCTGPHAILYAWYRWNAILRPDMIEYSPGDTEYSHLQHARALERTDRRKGRSISVLIKTEIW